MSGWGPWNDLDTGEVHVVPCDDARNVIGGHIKSPNCFCKPVRRDDEPRLIVHNDRERGGCNA